MGFQVLLGSSKGFFFFFFFGYFQWQKPLLPFSPPYARKPLAPSILTSASHSQRTYVCSLHNNRYIHAIASEVATLTFDIRGTRFTRPSSKKQRVHPYRSNLLIRWNRLCMINRFFDISNTVTSPRWVSLAICSHAMRGYCDLTKLSR